jgi:hypothetical protein
MAGRLTGRWGWQATLLPEQQASWLAAGGAALHSHLVCAWDGLAVEALEQHVCRLVGAELKEGIACASNSSSSSSAAAEGCGGQQQAMANGSTNFNRPQAAVAALLPSHIHVTAAHCLLAACVHRKGCSAAG